VTRNDRGTAGGQPTIWHQLWALECAYWADVDLGSGLEAASFYTDDAVFDLGMDGARLVGRSEIADFYERRRAGGPRTTAHLVHNFTVLEHDAVAARTAGYIVLHAASGQAPLPVGAPGMITVTHNRYRWIDDCWKIAERVSQVLFVAEDQPTFGPDSTPGREK